MTTAKSEILEKIRAAISADPEARESDYAAIPRDYIRTGTLDAAARVDLFADRLEHYDAVVYRCDPATIAATVEKAMPARGKTRLLTPANIPADWLPAQFEFTNGDDLAFHELDTSEGAITGCAAAIAFTGTIILCHAPGAGRRAITLVPDYYLCVVFTDQIVETVSEGLAALQGMTTLPLTTIAGPSATADIEMTRVKGVHGPRFLDVILVNREP